MPDITIGLDVGKTTHYAWVIGPDCTKLYAGKVNQDQQSLEKLFRKAGTYTGGNGTVTLVVDQPNNIGAFPIAVAQACGLNTAYLTGTRMRHASLLHKGNAKTDPKDACVIAETAIRMPESLLPVAHVEDVAERIKVIAGQIEDLVKMRTATTNRVRSSLNALCPTLEKALDGDKITSVWAITILTHYKNPTAIKRAGVARVTALLDKHCPRTRTRESKATQIIQAIAKQTLTVQNSDIKWQAIQNQLRMIATLNAEITALEEQVRHEAEALPHYHILRSMPGVGEKTAASIIMTVGDFSDFDTPEQLASYAGISPVTRQSGTSIKGEHVNRSGNKRLKNALWTSAFASIRSHERSRTYYDKKRKQGKRHNAAVMALARRRLTVMFSMVKNSVYYDDNYGQPAPAPMAQAA